MTTLERIAVVGASLAGLRAVEFIRRARFEGEIILIGDEAHLPYDRPPLSKEILRGVWERERLALRREGYEDLGVELVLGRRAVSLDPVARHVHLDDGGSISFDRLVIATGGRARELPNQPRLPGVHTLRTIDDALAIRAALAAGPRVAVIGAGFIGAEVAASARQLGLEVTVVEALDVPLALSLGPTVGGILQRAHERRGVRMHCGRRVASFEGRDRLQGLILDDGTDVPCELCVVGIGMTPSVGWLEGSGIALEDGVQCDETLATRIPGIVAAGDAASWYNPLFGERMRVEHWTNAVEQARHAVATLLAPPGEGSAFESVPVFWSDQFGLKIQGAGRPKPTDELKMARVQGDDKLVGLFGRAGRLVGAVTFNHPSKLIRLRKLIGMRAAVEDAREILEP
jgi:NADPH-dependent 2,4-dienoyl-CoA reductase/sulfur reductase-like enzyme